MKTVVQSMTSAERRNPTSVDASRRIRIAIGSGSDPAYVDDLLKQFQSVRRMLDQMQKPPEDKPRPRRTDPPQNDDNPRLEW